MNVVSEPKRQAGFLTGADDRRAACLLAEAKFLQENQNRSRQMAPLTIEGEEHLTGNVIVSSCGGNLANEEAWWVRDGAPLPFGGGEEAVAKMERMAAFQLSLGWVPVPRRGWGGLGVRELPGLRR